MKQLRTLYVALPLIVCGALPLVPFGCTPAQGAAVKTGGEGIALCILEHITELPEQIAKDCGAETVQDVIAVITAHRAAALREGYRPPPDAGSP